MNARIVSPLLALALLSGCVPLEERTAHFEGKWPAGTVTNVKINELNGTIWVQGDSPGAITMTANVRARGKRPEPGKPYDGYLTAELEGNVLSIRSANEHHGFHFGFGREITVDYELHVPQGTALNLVTVNGRIATRGIGGETSAKTINGAVDVEATGTNEVTCKSINGRIEAKFLSDFHGASLKTINGRVTAILPPSASFAGDFSQVNGDFEAAFPLNIHSNPGSRRVSGDVNGGRYDLKITTVNGDIKIDTPGPVAPATPATPAAPPAPPAAPRT
jgi:putative adhesin